MTKKTVHSVIQHNEEELELLQALDFEILDYENLKHEAVEFLIINGTDDIAQWDKAFKSKPQVRFISWGAPESIQDFILGRGVMVIDSKLFLRSPEYRMLVRSNVFKESTLHLQDKFQEHFETIARSVLTQSLRSGFNSDLISAYAHQNEFDIVPVRHYLNSLFLLFTYLKQRGIITLPVHLEYGSSADLFAVNATIHAPLIYLEYLLDFFREDTRNIDRGNLLWETFRSTHFLEIAHFANSQKLNIMGVWFRKNPLHPSMNVYEVDFIKSKWFEQQKTKLALGEDLLSETSWDELEAKPFKENESVQLPELKADTELGRDPAKLKGLMAEVVLRQTEKDTHKLQDNLSVVQISELLEDEETKQLFDELSTEDKEIFATALNSPANKNQLSEQINSAKESIKNRPKEKLTELIAQNLIEDLSTEDAEKMLEEGEEKQQKELFDKADTNPGLGEAKKEKLKEVLESSDVNPSHPFLTQAIEAVTIEEVTSEEIKEKLGEISSFVKESASDEDQKVKEVLDAFNNGHIPFEEMKEVVVEIQRGEHSEERPLDLTNKFKAIKKEKTSIIDGIKEATEEAFPDLSKLAKDQIEETAIESLKGMKDPEAAVKKVINNITPLLTEEISKIPGVNDLEEVLDKVSGKIQEKLNGNKMAKGHPVDENDEAIFSEMTEDEEEKIQKVVGRALESLDPEVMSIKSFAHILNSFETLPENKKSKKKNEDLAEQIMTVLSGIAEGLDKKVTTLTSEEIEENSASIIRGVTQLMKEDRETIRDNLLQNCLTEKNIVSDNSEENKLAQAKQIVTESLAALRNADLTEGQLVKEVAQDTNLSTLRILKALRDAKSQQEADEFKEIVSYVVEFDPNAGPEMIPDFEIELYEQDGDTKGSLSEQAQIVTAQKPQAFEKRNTLVKEAVSEKRSPADDKLIRQKLKQMEDENKKLVQENLNLKVDIETVKVKEKVNEAVRASQSTLLPQQQKVSGKNDTVLKAQPRITDEKKNILSGLPKNDEEAAINRLKANAKDMADPSNNDLMNLQKEMQSKEVFYENELKKLNLKIKKSEILAEKLKNSNGQLSENYEKQIQDLQTQMTAKPLIKQLIDTNQVVNPELARMKDENEKLKKMMERFKDKVTELSQRVNEPKKETVAKDFSEKKILEREVFDLKKKLEKSVKEQREKSQSGSEGVSEQSQSGAKRGLTNDSSLGVINRGSPPERKTSETKTEGEAAPKKNLFADKSSLGSNLAVEQELKTEITKLKGELLKAQAEARSAKGPVDKALPPRPSLNSSAVDGKAAAKEAQASEESNSDSKVKEKEISDLKKKVLNEVSEKNIYINKVKELEKIVKVMAMDQEKSEAEAAKESHAEGGKDSKASKTLGNALEANLKKELASLTLKYSKDQTELNDLKKKLARLEKAPGSVLAARATLAEGASEAVASEGESSPEERAESSKTKVIDPDLKKELMTAQREITGQENKIKQLEKDLANQIAKNSAGEKNIAKASVPVSTTSQSGEDQTKKDLNKARENEQQLKIDLTDTRNKLNQSEVKIKDLEEKIKALTGDDTEGGLTAGASVGAKSQILQMKATNKKLVADLLKSQQLMNESKKEVNSARQDKIALQNRVTQLQKELDKAKKGG